MSLHYVPVMFPPYVPYVPSLSSLLYPCDVSSYVHLYRLLCLLLISPLYAPSLCPLLCPLCMFSPMSPQNFPSYVPSYIPSYVSLMSPPVSTYIASYAFLLHPLLCSLPMSPACALLLPILCLPISPSVPSNYVPSLCPLPTCSGVQSNLICICLCSQPQQITLCYFVKVLFVQNPAFFHHHLLSFPMAFKIRWNTWLLTNQHFYCNWNFGQSIYQFYIRLYSSTNPSVLN